jgi:hypothetical protein
MLERRHSPGKAGKNGGTIESPTTTMPPVTPSLVYSAFRKKQFPAITQPPCSPDLALCDFCLVSRLNMGLKGHRFESAEKIQQNTTSGLRTIQEDDFQKYFQQWQNRWI